MIFNHRRPRWLNVVVLILIFSLTISCAPRSDLIAAHAMSPTPSATPFQPQPGISDSSYNSPTLHQAESTYTPMPAPRIPDSSFPTPIQIIPTPGGLPEYFSVGITNPLTGLPASDPALLNRRPMAIKISNYPRAIRPQFGLSLADVVFEYYIEWGDTRFIAIFYGNDSKQVGPVRSGRYFDEHIIRMYHAYYVFNFADPREYKYFIHGDLSDFLVTPGASGASCPPFFVDRVSSQISDAEHYMTYFDTSSFGACVARKGKDNIVQYIRNGFFSDLPVNGALTVNRIYTSYSNYSYNSWEYDAATRKYFRSEDSQDMINGKSEAYTPLTDLETGMPVTADNVVTLFVPYTFANQNEQQDEVYHIDLVDSGEAFVFRDGTALPARWYRTDIDQPLLLSTLSGVPIFLRPGRTFYEVIGETSTYTQNGTDWHFYFHTP